MVNSPKYEKFISKTEKKTGKSWYHLHKYLIAEQNKHRNGKPVTMIIEKSGVCIEKHMYQPIEKSTNQSTNQSGYACVHHLCMCVCVCVCVVYVLQWCMYHLVPLPKKAFTSTKKGVEYRILNIDYHKFHYSGAAVGFARLCVLWHYGK